MRLRTVRLASVLGTLLLFIAFAAAIPAYATTDSASSSREALIDTYMAGNEQYQGLAVAVSVGSEVQVRKDYGLAGISTGQAVSSSTAFEWGRVSDLIVWACVMQLVESGDVNLRSPIQNYLPAEVELPEGYSGLTLLDAMNHSTGLDVALVGSKAAVANGKSDILAALDLFNIEPGFAPGSIVGYTPLDSYLGAIVVQAVTGEAFCDYVREHIFAPLGMEDTVIMVAGDSSTYSSANSNDLSFSLAAGSPGPSSISSPKSTTSSVITCFGTVDDLLLFAQGLMGVNDNGLIFGSDISEQLFSVTRTYPSLGVARIAHGLFAFPLTTGAYGELGTTSSGYTCSLYMDPRSGLAIAVMVNQSGRADLAQGISRVLLGRSEISVDSEGSSENTVWAGTYQSAGNADQGAAKLLSALDRIVVDVNSLGVLTIGGLTATSLGDGVYSVDTAIDQDVYRFHVSLARGSEFSRVDEDYYIVSPYTLAVEGTLLVMLGVGSCVCLAYVLFCLGCAMKAIRTRKRPQIQIAPLFIAFSSVLACGSGAYGVYRLSTGLAPMTLGALLVGEGVYCVVVSLAIAWLLVTRWRGYVWTRGQNVVSAMVALSAVAVMLNLVYWEMLP